MRKMCGKGVSEGSSGGLAVAARSSRQMPQVYTSNGRERKFQVQITIHWMYRVSPMPLVAGLPNSRDLFKARRYYLLSILSAAMNASCRIFNLPKWRTLFWRAFCFSGSLRVTSPPHEPCAPLA